MKNICLIITILLSFLPVSAQQKQYSQEVIDFNNKAMELYWRNRSNKDSIAKSLVLLDKAIALDHNYLVAYGNKINILKGDDKYDEVLSTLDEAIRYNLSKYHLYLFKGLTLERLGYKKEALPFYKKGLELNELGLKEKPTVGLFLDGLLLKYCVYGIDTPVSDVITAIPPSFTEEERKSVERFMDIFGSFKNFKDGSVKDNSRPLNNKRSAMPKKREDGVYYVVEELAEYPGGHDAMLAFISENFKKPSSINKSGTILVNFVVEADGTLTNIVVKHGLCEGLDKEALRVVGIMPKWKPAKVDGKAVAMVFNIPLTIK